MPQMDTTPYSARLIRAIMNDIVGEGKCDVANIYLPWDKFSDDEISQAKDYLRKWESEGYLEIIGDLDTWDISKVCYTMKNYIGATEPLPDNWIK